MRYSIILAVSILFFIPAIGFSATLKVPSQYPTIQDAIDAALDGDTVLVAPGTYVEVIDFKSKAITVSSEQGPDVTIINGNQAGSVATFNTGEDLDSVLDGFTISNGSGTFISNEYFGGGIYCTSSSPTITNNIITGNSASLKGGGIYCEDNSSPTITNNIFIGNFAAEGGGIYCLFSSPEITKNTIHNSNSVMGGGINCKNSSPTISNNTITGSTGGLQGGGIKCSESSPTIINNTIFDNTSLLGGGGVCIVTNSFPTLTNNTIHGNSSSKGGGIYCSNSSVTITNTILWNNDAPTGPEIWLGNSSYPSTLTISYSDLEGGKALVYIDPGCTLNWGPGMIDAAPIFVAGSHGFYYLSQIAAGQPVDSPCVDTGSDLASNLGMDIYWTRTDEVPDSGIVDIGFHYGSFTFPRLQRDTFKISAGTGGDAHFLLLAGTYNANRNYILLGSISGTYPGTPLPGGQATLPLNMDSFTVLVYAMINSAFFSNFLGILDISGSSTAKLNAIGPISPSAVGTVMSFAYALNNPWNFASSPVGIEIVP